MSADDLALLQRWQAQIDSDDSQLRRIAINGCLLWGFHFFLSLPKEIDEKLKAKKQKPRGFVPRDRSKR